MNIDQHILRALRQEPDDGPPADFARSVAACVASAPSPGAGVEQWLLRGLVAALVLSGLVVAALQGRDWMGAALRLLPAAEHATALNWSLAAGACLAATWVMSRLAPAPTARP